MRTPSHAGSETEYMDGSIFLNFIVWYLVFLFSTSLHEAAHAAAAALGGDDTGIGGGQATLNPIPHIQREKVGMVLAPIVSFFLMRGSWMFGWASVPFNPFWAARHPKRAFVMSLAGPLSHLVPALLSWLCMVIGMRYGYFAPDFGALHPASAADPSNSVAAALALILSVMFKLNLVLCIFNLLPFPPMDGSEAWYLLVRAEEDRLRLRHTLASYGPAGLLLAWWAFPRVFAPVFGFFIRQLLRFGMGL
jgi:Zn-dependent protease